MSKSRVQKRIVKPKIIIDLTEDSDASDDKPKIKITKGSHSTKNVDISKSSDPDGISDSDELIKSNNQKKKILNKSTKELSTSAKELSKDKVKELVWKKYCPEDDDIGYCFCCNDEIKRSKTHVEFGHIVPESKGGEYNIENIRPICIKCNRGKGGMHKMNMYEYIVRNQMYGLRHLKLYERELYVYNIQEKKKVVRNCLELLSSLLKEKFINIKIKDELYKIIIKDEDPTDLLFQHTIKYVLSLSELLDQII